MQHMCSLVYASNKLADQDGYEEHDSEIPSAADKKLTIMNAFSQPPWRASEPEPMHSMLTYSGSINMLANLQDHLWNKGCI